MKKLFILAIAFLISAFGVSQTNLSTYGVVGDGVTDDTSALQTALDSGNDLVANPGLTFLISATLFIDTSGDQDIDWNGGTVITNTANLRMFEIHKSSGEISMNDLDVDGQDLGRIGFWIYSRFVFNNVDVANLRSTVSLPVLGFRITLDAGFTGNSSMNGCDCDDLDTTNNGVIGDNVGVSRCFMTFAENDFNHDAEILLENFNFSNVYSEDGDVFDLNAAAPPNQASELGNFGTFIKIRNGTVTNWSRRGIKGLAGGWHMYNVTWNAPLNSDPRLPKTFVSPGAGMVALGNTTDPYKSVNVIVEGCTFNGSDYEDEVIPNNCDEAFIVDNIFNDVDLRFNQGPRQWTVCGNTFNSGAGISGSGAYNPDESDLRISNDNVYNGGGGLTQSAGFTWSTGSFTCTTTGLGSGNNAISAVSVSPSAATLDIGNTQQLTLGLTPSSPDDATGTWSSATPAVATVDSNGLVTAVSDGTAVITWTATDTTNGTISDTSTITVNAAATLGVANAFPNLTFDLPVHIEAANDGSNRLFVVEHEGIIKSIDLDDATPTATTYLDLTSTVNYIASNESGLLGLTFHPNFSSNGYAYVFYTDDPSDVRINVVRYTESGGVLTAPFPIIQISKTGSVANQTNHNGACLKFGPDGYLYVSIGDGGGGGDPNNSGQDLNSLFGKMLRLDVDGGSPYAIPAENPTSITGQDEIWAMGLRNMWKFSFDENGNLWGGDVGQNARCEINYVPVADITATTTTSNFKNFGWDNREGSIAYSGGAALSFTPRTDPVYDYSYGSGDRSVTGGFVYRGSLTNTEVVDKYIFADYITGRIWSLTTDTYTRTELFNTDYAISSFGEDEAGELYFTHYNSNGAIYKLTGQTGSGGNSVTLDEPGRGNWLRDITTVSTNGVDLDKNGRYLFAQNNGSLVRWSGYPETLATSNGIINDVHVASDGTIYVGGTFTTFDGVSANRIAYSTDDGATWQAMATGMDNAVFVINSFGSTIYAGGTFTTAGGVSTTTIASWNGSTWSTLGTGLNNEVREIHIDASGTLRVGGNFATAGGSPALATALWNGSTWSAIQGGTAGFTQAIEQTPSGEFYFGGIFQEVGGNTAVNRIAKLDGSTWSGLGNGVNGGINTIKYHKGFIYVAGSFETASNTSGINITSNYVARWSEATGWLTLGNVGAEGVVNDMIFKNDHLMVVGSFGAELWYIGGSSLIIN